MSVKKADAGGFPQSAIGHNEQGQLQLPNEDIVALSIDGRAFAVDIGIMSAGELEQRASMLGDMAEKGTKIYVAAADGVAERLHAIFGTHTKRASYMPGSTTTDKTAGDVFSQHAMQ